MRQSSSENLEPQGPRSVERTGSVFLEHVANDRNIVLLDKCHDQALMFCAAQTVTTEAINQMTHHARGIISLALWPESILRLGLTMQPTRYRSAHAGSYCVSIEARHGITTGISAAERAHTIRVATAQEACASDLVSPGHVFPICVGSCSHQDASKGDLLSNLKTILQAVQKSGKGDGAVYCHILNHDGQMASVAQASGMAQDTSLLTIDGTELEGFVHANLDRTRLFECPNACA